MCSCTVKSVVFQMGHHCCSKQKVKRGLWSPEEDEKLVKYITTQGHGCWSSVPKQAGLQRCGKSCRLRWINYLRPDLKRGSFSAQEERIIIDVHRILGNRWAQIAKHLPGRTDNEVKNFWNSCIKKKLIAQGLDPKTHNLIPSHYPNSSSCSLSQPPNTTPFTINTSSKMGESYIDMNPSFITFPPTNPQLHEPIKTDISTFQSQDPNLLWNFKDQNSQNSMGFLNQTTLENTPISSSINPPGSGLIEENSFWSIIVEPSEEAQKQKKQQEQVSQEQEQEPKMYQVGFDEINEEKGQEMETSYNNSSNFDLDFVESTLMPMYCNVSSMDEFSWDY